jgi:tetratricopeptide (TPR) repeat protein
MRSILGWVFLIACAAAAPARADWHEARSKHFIIYSDDRPDRLREFAERLERFDQAVRHVRQMEDPALTDTERLTVYALRSEGAVESLIGASGARGMYEARASGAVAFVPRHAGSGDTFDLGTEAIFFHEYAHHLQLQRASLALPTWVTEGFAEFFATAQIKKDGSVLIGSPPLYRAYSLMYGNALPLEQMLGGTYGRLNQMQTDWLYGRGWLLMHFLTFQQSREGQLSRYLDAIQSGTSATTAARNAFGDLKQLDRELSRYLGRSLTGMRVHANALTVGPIALRQLVPCEAAVMDAHIRSTRGVDRRTAAAVAVNARKRAAPCPNDAFAQSALAEADLDADNFDAAEAAADRALKANPATVAALLFKGRARMERARKDPAKADWQEIRSWFLRANKLATENAEPLMLYYQSYGYAGQKPTGNAVKALLYAVDLAPQDSGLRLIALRQLLGDGKLAEARTMFAPLAFQPHATAELREVNMKIMDAIAAGNAQAALQLIDDAQKKAEAEASKA